MQREIDPEKWDSKAGRAFAVYEKVLSDMSKFQYGQTCSLVG